MNQTFRGQRAGSFGRVVDDYERGRPRYPDEAVRWLVGDAQKVIDLGAGTGKLTSSLVQRIPEVVAIEPQEPMVKRLQQSVAGARSICAVAEALPVRDGWADAVLVAQAFHWFDQERAVPEIARVLGTGGHLGLVWNVRDESVDWVGELALIAGRDNSRETRGALPQVPPFGGFVSRKFRMVQVLDRESLLAHVRSRSNVAALPEAERAEVVAAVGRLCDVHPDLAGRDHFDFPYVTVAYRVEKA